MEFTHTIHAAFTSMGSQSRENMPQRSLTYPVHIHVAYFLFYCMFIFKSAAFFEHLIWNEWAFLLIEKTMWATIKSSFKLKLHTSLFLNCFCLVTQDISKVHNHMKLKSLKCSSQLPKEHQWWQSDKCSSRSKTPAQVLKHSRMLKPVQRGDPWLWTNRHRTTAVLGWTAKKMKAF